MSATSVLTNAHFDKVWNFARIGMILIDENGEVQLWNDWLVKHSGISREAALNRRLEQIFQEDASPAFHTAIHNALTYKLPIVLSTALHRMPLPLFRSTHNPQRIYQSISITPIHTDGHYLFLIQIADASAHVRRERVLKSRSDRLKIEAITDSLTGVYNRRYFDTQFQIELARAKRRNIPFTLIFMDVDFFKQYNDHYGHQAGDDALNLVANAIKNQLGRAGDFVARYGGEEFVVILPESEQEQGGVHIAEKLRKSVSQLGIPHQASEIADHLTVSAGVAVLLPGSDYNMEDLLRTADNALYQAKSNGRNCVQHQFVTVSASS